MIRQKITEVIEVKSYKEANKLLKGEWLLLSTAAIHGTVVYVLGRCNQSINELGLPME